MHRSLERLLAVATEQLAQAEVPTPGVDAELLAAHVVGQSRGRLRALALTGHEIDDAAVVRYQDLLDERARRVPLQHLTGTAAFRSLELRVGPGVFVPRPETEQVAQIAVEHLRTLDRRAPRIIDLGTGSGALAAALAAEAADYGSPGAEVHAVELSEQAAAWAELNLAPLGVTLHRGDIRAIAQHGLQALPELAAESALNAPGGRGFDVVVSNPPYIPPSMVPLDPEVAQHDPQLALYGGGDDGLEMPSAVIAAAQRLLEPGGWFIVEHAEVQAAQLGRRCRKNPRLSEVETHRDLAGRHRATSARLLAQVAAPERPDPADLPAADGLVEEWRA